MKLLLLLCSLLAAVYANAVHFNEFDAIIEKVNSAGAKWKAGHNFDKGTTMSHIKRLLGARKSPEKLELREKHITDDSDIPAEFDSRKEWANCKSISHIGDQGNCGSCWAIAAATTLTDRFCIASNGFIKAPLSTQDLLSCCGLYCGYGCNGGYSNRAWGYFTVHGIVTGGDYNSNIGCQPYGIQPCEHHTTGNRTACSDLPDENTPECRKICANLSYKQSYAADTYRTQRSYTLENNENEIKKEILLHGPVEAGFTVYSDFPAYKTGVYHHVTGDALGGHDVRVIGWGVEEGNTPYWLVANSWNEDWGDHGLFKILRGSNECGFEEEVVAVPGTGAQNVGEVGLLCRKCGRENETPSHVLGCCPHNHLLINRRHHRVKHTIMELLAEKGFKCHEEVYSVDSDGSPRFADIIYFKPNSNKAFILDPTERYESNDMEQAENVDREKRKIYEKCIPFYQEKFREEVGDKEFQVMGLWLGSRGTIGRVARKFFDVVGIDTEKLRLLAESILIDSLGIINNHIYG